MSSKLKWRIAIALAVAGVAIIVYQTRWRDAATRGTPHGRGGFNQPVAVRLATVHAGSIDVVLNGLGTVTARRTAVVHARVDGLLQQIHFQEGREVQAGALLAEIDPRPFDAALEQARGQLARDQALLATAKNDLARYQTLLSQDSIASQQVDDQASLVHQYEGVVQSDQGNVDIARLQRDFTRITAPIAGRAGLRQVDVGNMVHAADTNGVVVLTETRPISVIFALPANQANEVIRRWNAGAELKVQAYGADNTTLLATGRLESTDNQIDPATGTVKLRAIFANSDGALFPNQFVNARLTLATLDNQVLAPAAAVQHGTPGTFVYLLHEDSTVEARRIVVGTGNGDTVAVMQGLRPGDRIVAEGTDKLRDGARVQAAAEPPPATTGHRKGSHPGGRHWGSRPSGAGDAGGPGSAGPPGGRAADGAGNAAP